MQSAKPCSHTIRRPGVASAAPPLRLDAEALFVAGREVVIVHAGEAYRLRLTRLNKLILTK